MLQDISIYYEKCLPICNSNICPDAMPYFKDLNVDQCVASCGPNNYADLDTKHCVADCKTGYTEQVSDYTCVAFSFCHSTCATCSTNNA